MAPSTSSAPWLCREPCGQPPHCLAAPPPSRTRLQELPLSLLPPLACHPHWHVQVLG